MKGRREVKEGQLVHEYRGLLRSAGRSQSPGQPGGHCRFLSRKTIRCK